MKDEEILLHEGRFLALWRRGRWEYARRTNSPGAVLIVAFTADDALILVEQVRVPLGAPCIELPAGIAGDAPEFEGESFVAAARRELLEETGYEAGRLVKLASAAANPGMDTEMLHFYAGFDLVRVGPGGGDASEDITVHEVPRAELRDWLAQREAAGARVAQNVYAGLGLWAQVSR